ncbi:hypothetical protein J7I94_16070 [Streptomyces sp. ISL-12]|uniref:hypothetical protein n=1 Tax=Streptomyces sp. ISL-12 TaxID=2819177 RepID=UPI001BE71959|nr:hypothetical protein [Streptomyces sp. ISL-12]MBT2412067.1 hypothetical protein [Streptomyces sp. ISL-12]
MTPRTQPTPPQAPQPAAALEQHLEEALCHAHFAARVDLADNGAALQLTMLSSLTPFDRTVEAATAWLSSVGINGTAAFNEAYDIVLTLDTAAAVRQFVAVLLEPRIRAHTAADDLAELLSAHGLLHRVRLQGTSAMEVTLADDDLSAAVRFAAGLGAVGIDAGLMLNRPRGMRRLAERLQWLVTGAVGSAVHAAATPGCSHSPDLVTLHLTVDQAQSLAQRLRPVGEDHVTVAGTDRPAGPTGVGEAA